MAFIYFEGHNREWSGDALSSFLLREYVSSCFIRACMASWCLFGHMWKCLPIYFRLKWKWSLSFMFCLICSLTSKLLYRLPYSGRSVFFVSFLFAKFSGLACFIGVFFRKQCLPFVLVLSFSWGAPHSILYIFFYFLSYFFWLYTWNFIDNWMPHHSMGQS